MSQSRTVPTAATKNPSAVHAVRGATTAPHPVTLSVYGIALDCPSCQQPTTAFLGFRPTDGLAWEPERVVLCNTASALALADAVTSEGAHILNAVGRPRSTDGPSGELVNRCVHCQAAITGDDLAGEVRRTYLDALVDLGQHPAPRHRVTAAIAGAGSFLSHGDIPHPRRPRRCRALARPRRPLPSAR